MPYLLALNAIEWCGCYQDRTCSEVARLAAEYAAARRRLQIN